MSLRYQLADAVCAELIEALVCHFAPPLCNRHFFSGQSATLAAQERCDCLSTALGDATPQIVDKGVEPTFHWVSEFFNTGDCVREPSALRTEHWVFGKCGAKPGHVNAPQIAGGFHCAGSEGRVLNSLPHFHETVDGVALKLNVINRTSGHCGAPARVGFGAFP